MKLYSEQVVPADYPGADQMGENLRGKLKYCGEGVRLYPYFKMIRAENASLDDHCMIWDNVFIDAGKSLSIGKYTLLTWQVLIEGGAETHIGDRVFIGPGAKLITGTYEFNGYYTSEYVPAECHKNRYGNIIIENDAYIGANVVIMPGTIIHEGALVGANAFVKGELEPWTIYAGNPAKPISKRIPPNKEKRDIVEAYYDWSNPLYHFDVKND